jgi:hypothetical protein
MKRGTKWFLLLVVFLPFIISSSVIQKTAGNDSQAGLCEKLKPCQLLTQAAAEKILGQSVRLIADRSGLKGDVRQCACAYTAVTKDPASGQDINLYFVLEQQENHPSAEQARRVMDSTRSDNAHDAVIRDLSGIGDQAFLFGEESNVHFIMARKGAIVIRLQIKQATEKTSLEELKAFAREIAKRL